MAALYYGAWISQYAARAAGGGPQDGGQLLLPLDPAVPGVDGIGRNILVATGDGACRAEASARRGRRQRAAWGVSEGGLCVAQALAQRAC